MKIVLFGDLQGIDTVMPTPLKSVSIIYARTCRLLKKLI
jgi:hypothetical protein